MNLRTRGGTVAAAGLALTVAACGTDNTNSGATTSTSAADAIISSQTAEIEKMRTLLKGM